MNLNSLRRLERRAVALAGTAAGPTAVALSCTSPGVVVRLRTEQEED